MRYFNSFSANPTKWSNTLKHFVGLALNGLMNIFHLLRDIELCDKEMVAGRNPSYAMTL